MIRRLYCACIGAALLHAGSAVFAQGAPRSYAVLSEMAREVMVTNFQESTGTRLGANLTTRIPIPEGALDKVALVTAKQNIEKLAKGAPVWLVAPLDTDLFDARAVYTEGTTLKVPDDLAAALKEHGSTHLLLFTRLRDEANLRAQNARVGTGLIEGPGFYIDRHTKMTNLDTLTTTAGFIAPYLYMRATLLDARTGVILATRRVVEGEVLSASVAEQSGDPWSVMTPTEKVAQISAMIKREVDKAVPALLAVR